VKKLRKIEELIKDSDIASISQKAASSFRGVLSDDEIDSCIKNAVWKASSKFNPKEKTKFTSFLYKGVKFECSGQARLNRRKKACSLSKFDKAVNINDNFNGFNRIDMLDEISVCEDPMLIYDRFYRNMTIKELADMHNVCGETIRNRIEKNLKKIKKSLTDG